MKAKSLTAIALISCLGTAALAQEPVRIGLITTLTTPAAIIGRDVEDAIRLSVEHIGGEMAGRPVKLIVEDDALSPETGRQKTEKLVRQDKVDFLTGYIWSNVLLASRKSALDAGTFLISTNAAPSDMAGKLCDPKFFSMRGQGDVMSMALGEELNRRGVAKVYTMAPNYAAGQDVVKGFESTFRGEIVGQDFTKWGDDPQLDFSAEFSKVAASGAEALFAFYPGRSAAFMTQFEQSGLKDRVKLYTVYTLDQIALPSLQDGNAGAALGSVLTDYWYPGLDTEANKRFVEGFREKYGRDPSNYAAAAYDAIGLIKSAVEAVEGDLENEAGLRKALEAAGFDSVRGQIVFGKNHMPLDNYYALEVVAGEDGKWQMGNAQLALERGQDPYIDACDMPAAE
ncbi:ABC transporter substrate-binding protein [Pseudogemmobacter humi]|uniref:Leucine-binding protein domain-containing protein n=1 Tax=Pseudogemmobacter humi TaxID=2483812 RepID=A0A3P5WVZ1_9RHOB|nr:ABC transporter substrate-binding protein [Pseudogemmobacter humi]VDC19081.1 hypothetical protein XINFAN_00081 [Pseudogemmobacter humi]